MADADDTYMEDNHDNDEDHLDQLEVTAQSAADAARKEVEKEPEILVKRRVIDDDLIREVIQEEMLTFYEPVYVPEAKKIDLWEVTTLVLSFRDIYSISNLEGFERLTKLQLDNNIISKITNLDHLVNLEWLDLSFNNIRVIEGLDKLTKLTDLSLFNNQITTIPAMSTLVNLNCFSVGNNSINDLECIKSLRKFSELQLLNMKGNPVCKKEDYRNTCLAFLPKLKYLDYELVNPASMKDARENKSDILNDLEAQETLDRITKEERQLILNRQEALKKSNVGGIWTVFDSTVAADTEAEKLRLLPAYSKILEIYRSKFDAIIENFCDEILEKAKGKTEEDRKFRSALNAITAEYEQKTIDAIQTFEHRKKKAFRAYAASVVRGRRDPSLLENLKKSVVTLSEELMDLEVITVEANNTMIDDFNEAYNLLSTANVLVIQNSFRLLQETASQTYSIGLIEAQHDILDRYNKEDGEREDIFNDIQLTGLLNDKDALGNAISQSTDKHMEKILYFEALMTEQEEASKAVVKNARKDEYLRNRNRVKEIYGLADRYYRMIDDEASKAMMLL